MWARPFQSKRLVLTCCHGHVKVSDGAIAALCYLHCSARGRLCISQLHLLFEHSYPSKRCTILQGVLSSPIPGGTCVVQSVTMQPWWDKDDVAFVDNTVFFFFGQLTLIRLGVIVMDFTGDSCFVT